MLCALLLQLALEATSKKCALRCEHWSASSKLHLTRHKIVAGCETGRSSCAKHWMDGQQTCIAYPARMNCRFFIGTSWPFCKHKRLRDFPQEDIESRVQHVARVCLPRRFPIAQRVPSTGPSTRGRAPRRQMDIG